MGQHKVEKTGIADIQVRDGAMSRITLANGKALDGIVGGQMRLSDDGTVVLTLQVVCKPTVNGLPIGAAVSTLVGADGAPITKQNMCGERWDQPPCRVGSDAHICRFEHGHDADCECVCGAKANQGMARGVPSQPPVRMIHVLKSGDGIVYCGTGGTAANGQGSVWDIAKATCGACKDAANKEAAENGRAVM